MALFASTAGVSLTHVPYKGATQTALDVAVPVSFQALADPGGRERPNSQGLSVRGSSPEELGAATQEQLSKYARLMKQAGVVVE